MKNLRLSCDDGCASDVRVAELAEKYGIDCTFYWPVEWHSLAYENGYEPLDFYNAMWIIHEMGFELGSHTITHNHLTKIPEAEAIAEIVQSKQMLERLFDTKITKFCPPRGYTNDKLTDITLSIYESQRLTKGKELVHVHPSSGANGNKKWQDCVTEDTEELWFHSHELDRFNLWEELEEFLREYTYSK